MYFQAKGANIIEQFRSTCNKILPLSTRTSSKSKTFSDSFVVFKDHDGIGYGSIEAIFHVTPDDIYLIKVNLLKDEKFERLFLDGKEYVNEHIIYGHFSGNQCRIIYQHLMLLRKDVKMMAKTVLFLPDFRICMSHHDKV